MSCAIHFLHFVLIFSQFAGVYESFDTICIYLESDQPSGFDPDKNFWVHYKMAIINQKNSAKTVCKESSICTKTWNNSVLQFMKVSDLLDTDAGFLVRDTVIFVCEIIDCCPWFDFSDLEVRLDLLFFMWLVPFCFLCWVGVNIDDSHDTIIVTPNTSKLPLCCIACMLLTKCCCSTVKSNCSYRM